MGAVGDISDRYFILRHARPVCLEKFARDMSVQAAYGIGLGRELDGKIGHAEQLALIRWVCPSKPKKSCLLMPTDR